MGISRNAGFTQIAKNRSQRQHHKERGCNRPQGGAYINDHRRWQSWHAIGCRIVIAAPQEALGGLPPTRTQNDQHTNHRNESTQSGLWRSHEALKGTATYPHIIRTRKEEEKACFITDRLGSGLLGTLTQLPLEVFVSMAPQR